jgi:general secretion pathway protein G
MKRINNLKLKIKNWERGFTLIELLIVIAIIGVLSTLLMANFIGVRQRARDSQRKSDLRQIQSALEIYRSDNPLGQYPVSLACSGSLTQLINGSTVNYMTKIPCDPSGSGISYQYSQPDPSSYQLIACLENTGDSQKDSSVQGTCATTTGASFTVQSQ